MSDMAADRVYDQEAEPTEVYVAAGVGVVAVSVSAGRVGRFGVERRCSPRDIAGGESHVAVATDEDVLIRGVEDADGDGGREFHPTGFGPAEAVGIRDGTVLAAGHGGEISRLDPPSGTEGGWTGEPIGRVGGNVTAIDGALIATDAGLYRVADDGGAETVQVGGFEVVTDVAAAGPFVATDAGLYALDEAWRWEIQGGCRAVSAASLDRAHAAAVVVYERGEGGWDAVEVEVPGEVVDVATGEAGYAVTEGGTILVGPEWRSRSLGVRDVVGIAVVP